MMLALGAMAFTWAQSAPSEQAVRKLLDDGEFRGGFIAAIKGPAIATLSSASRL
jgi:hypothetical protein